MKRISLFLLFVAIIICIVLPSLAVTTNGPSKYATLATETKKKTTAEPAITISSISIGGTGKYIFWIRDRESDTQVTSTYYFDSTGAKTIYYRQKWRNAGYVLADRTYDARVKSNSSVSANETASITSSSFVP